MLPTFLADGDQRPCLNEIIAPVSDQIFYRLASFRELLNLVEHDQRLSGEQARPVLQ